MDNPRRYLLQVGGIGILVGAAIWALWAGLALLLGLAVPQDLPALCIGAGAFAGVELAAMHGLTIIEEEVFDE